jgi:hypothetical protein
MHKDLVPCSNQTKVFINIDHRPISLTHLRKLPWDQHTQSLNQIITKLEALLYNFIALKMIEPGIQSQYSNPSGTWDTYNEETIRIGLTIALGTTSDWELRKGGKYGPTKGDRQKHHR